MPPVPVRAVLFDDSGVLRRDDTVEFDAFAAGYDAPAGVLSAAFHGIREYHLLRAGLCTTREYRTAVVRALARLLGPDRAEECAAGWENTLAVAPPLEAEMARLLSRLRGRVRLGILSNAGPGGTRRLEASGIARPFDAVLCAGDVGVAKPAPDSYRLAAERLGVPLEACAFVDDLEENVEGARAVGMHAHRHHRSRHQDLLAFLERVGALPAPEPALAS